jgi:protein-L-isoaspartate(D-aspartate) O-methyltransferase
VSAAAPAFEERAALLLAVRRAGVRDISVMRAFESVPREAFAPFRFRDLATHNMSLPLPCGQTMSRPSDLARRIEALRVGRGQRVLEIGAGSGYGTALLAHLAREVVAVERFAALAIEAGQRLADLGIDNAQARQADGFALDAAEGPFDRILIQAALTAPPRELLRLLAPDGALIYVSSAPALGERRPRQRLIRLDHDADGVLRETDLGPHSLGVAAPGLALAL